MKGSLLRLESAIYTMPENDHPGLCQLHLNENMFVAAKEAQECLFEECSAGYAKLLGRYPVGGAAELMAEISRKSRCSLDSVVVANGSSELLRLLFISLLSRADRVMIPTPGWSFYALCAELVGAEIIKYELAVEVNAYSYDVALIRNEIIQAKPSVVVICSPNNPTGNSVDSAHLMALVTEFADVNFIVDQAYWGFVDDDESFAGMTQQAALRSNLFVTRSFSKFLGLANVRIGFLICNKSRAKAMSALSPVFGVSSLSQDLAIQRLNDHRLHHLIRKEFLDVRRHVFETLREMDGAEPYWTDANFMLVRFRDGATHLLSSLQRHGFVVKQEAIASGETHLRVTIADSGTMTRFLDTVRMILRSSQ